jgi:hypothetical protein
MEQAASQRTLAATDEFLWVPGNADFDRVLPGILLIIWYYRV